MAGGMYLFSRVLAPRPVVLNPPGCRKIARTINENISESDIDILCSPSDCCVARNLNKKILTLYGRHLNDSGTEVDYEGFARDPEFQEYVDICRDLEKVHLSAMRREEWMSFLINLYNCLVIHGYLERGVPGNLLSRLYFFSSVRFESFCSLCMFGRTDVILAPSLISLNECTRLAIGLAGRSIAWTTSSTAYCGITVNILRRLYQNPLSLIQTSA